MKFLPAFGKHLLFVISLFLLVPGQPGHAQAPAQALAHDFTAETTSFLGRYVDNDGKVDYATIQRNPEQLEALLFNVAGFDVAHAAPADQYAFYLNAYNVLVIADIVHNYPLKSVQDMPGFFNKTRHRVGREQLTLDQIETDKLRQIYDDPRLHFALVCGTRSCPRLSRTAYVGPQLFGQLDRQAQFALAAPGYVKVDAARRQVKLPEIFRWYEADFSNSGYPGVRYVNQFRQEKSRRVPTGYAVGYYAYDWSLNDQAAR